MRKRVQTQRADYVKVQGDGLSPVRPEATYSPSRKTDFKSTRATKLKGPRQSFSVITRSFSECIAPIVLCRLLVESVQYLILATEPEVN